MQRQRKRMTGIVIVAETALLASLTQAAIDATYKGTNGNWSTGTDWTSTPTANTAPNGIDDIARGKNAATSTTLDANIKLGTFTQANAFLWTVNTSGSNAFTFDVTSGSAAISTTATGGGLTVNPNIVINDNLVISNPASATGSILLSGSITGTGNVTVTGNSSTAASTGKIQIGSLSNSGSVTLNGASTNVASFANASNHVTVDSISNSVTALTVARTLAGSGVAYGDVRINGGALSATVTGDANQTILKASGSGDLIVSGNNSTTYSGVWSAGLANGVDAGSLQFGSANAIGNSAKISVSSGGRVVAGYAIDQGFIDRILTTAVTNGPSVAANGVIAFGVNSSNDLNLTAIAGLAQLNLGAASGTTATYSGAMTITTDGTATYKLGGGGGTLIISKTDALTDNTPVATLQKRGLAVAGTSQVDAQTVTSVLNITAPQSFTGVVSIEGGTLRTNSLALGGSASGLGKSTNAAANLVFNTDDPAVPSILEYNGSANTTTDRLFTFGRFGAGQILNNGDGTVNFSNAGTMANTATTTPATPSTLTLGGANAGDNIMAVKLIDSTGAGTKALALVKKDAGKWTLKNNNTYSGGTTINAGTLLVSNTTVGVSGTGTGAVNVVGGTLGGTGTISGAVSVGTATLAPGASAGTLTVNNALTLSSTATTQMELGGTSTSQYDRVVGVTNLTLDGTVNVTLIDGFTPSNGNTFDLFDWTGTPSTSGFNVATDLLLPALGPGLQWNRDNFLSDGSISVVPEPATLAFVGMGGLLLAARRRRR